MFVIQHHTYGGRKANTENQQNTMGKTAMGKMTLTNDKASFDYKQKKANSLLKQSPQMGSSAIAKTGLCFQMNVAVDVL